jgi:feruloyl esterase
MITQAAATSNRATAIALTARVLSLAAAAFISSGVSGVAFARNVLTPERCAALRGSVPEGEIASAKWVDAAGAHPAFCAVSLQLASEPGSHIKAVLEMPANWNGRFLGIGDHGFGGYIPEADMQRPLARGFAVFASDMGHTGRVVDASWMAPAGPALKDFGWRANHVAAVAAKAVVTKAYGRAPRFAYFQGCSTGGRMAMREAQQFPGDFNGVIVGSAPLDWDGIMTQQLWSTSQVLRDGAATPGWIPPAQYSWISAATLARCDKLDGLKDGLVIDPRRCATDIGYLTCRTGQTTDCLTAAQVEAIERIYAPLSDPTTGAFIIDGLEPTGEYGWVSPLGSNARLGEHVSGYFAALFGSTGWDWRKFNFSGDFARARKLDRNGAQIDSLETNLAPFGKRGGKIIQYHGWLDPAMSPGFYPKFYERVAATTTGGDMAKLANFYRLFMVPGMGHCSTGTGPDSFGGFEQPLPPTIDPQHDVLSALVAWVEQGRAPESLIATQYKDEKPANGVAREMPLCSYPEVAHRVGQGDPNRASSFACMTDRGATTYHNARGVHG